MVARPSTRAQFLNEAPLTGCILNASMLTHLEAFHQNSLFLQGVSVGMSCWLINDFARRGATADDTVPEHLQMCLFRRTSG